MDDAPNFNAFGTIDVEQNERRVPDAPFAYAALSGFLAQPGMIEQNERCLFDPGQHFKRERRIELPIMFSNPAQIPLCRTGPYQRSQAAAFCAFMA